MDMILRNDVADENVDKSSFIILVIAIEGKVAKSPNEIQ